VGTYVEVFISKANSKQLQALTIAAALTTTKNGCAKETAHDSFCTVLKRA
jgi:hypothetical protein